MCGELGLVVHVSAGMHGEEGVDRGDNVTHVAHVGGAGRARLEVGSSLHGSPQLRYVPVEEFDQDWAVDQVLIGVADLFDVECAPGRCCGGCEAGDDLFVQFCHAVAAPCPHVPRGSGHRRDDVGGIAAVGDDAVDLVGGVEGLAQRGDVDVGLHEGVECVDAELRGERGV